MVQRKTKLAKELVMLVSNRLQRNQEDILIDQTIKEGIEGNPRIVFSLLYLLLKDHSTKEGVQTKTTAYQANLILLEEALLSIRYSVERDRPWALDIAEQIQRQIAKKVFIREVDIRIQADLVHVLYGSGLVTHLVRADTISSLTLRRMIGLRNWLPEGERPALDELIKRVRRAKVQCAPMPSVQSVETYVSPFDGSGIQGAWIFSREQQQHQMAMMLVRQEQGVREVWFEDDARVDELLKENFDFPILGRDMIAQAIGLILLEILQDRSELWQERLLWMALWAKSCRDRTRSLWRKFFIIARELRNGRPLYQIPLMISVAERSVYSALRRMEDWP